MIPLEIERKFLIEQTNEIDLHCSKRIDIVQTYLKRENSELQRRVRSMTVNNQSRYFYTEKKFISAGVREENEREISADEYSLLLKQADNSLKTIIKTRKILIHENQHFEIDSYPFSDVLATMELELPDINTQIIFPPFIKIIKEVTSDNKYSNANLALNGKFPD